MGYVKEQLLKRIYVLDLQAQGEKTWMFVLRFWNQKKTIRCGDFVLAPLFPLFWNSNSNKFSNDLAHKAIQSRAAKKKGGLSVGMRGGC